MKLKLTYEFEGLKIEGVTETQNDICEFAKECKIVFGEFITKDLIKHNHYSNTSTPNQVSNKTFRPASEKQLKLLETLGAKIPENLSSADASKLIDKIKGMGQ